MKRSTILFAICALITMISSLCVAAQQPNRRQGTPATKRREATVAKPDAGEPQIGVVNPTGPVFSTLMTELPAGRFLSNSVESTFERVEVKNAPITADAMTEHSQLMIDGNRIMTTTSTRIYRDSEGRTRIERTPPARPQADGLEQNKTITISDPVSKETYHLMSKSRMAFKTPRFDLNNAVRISSADAALAINGRIADDQKNANAEGNAAQQGNQPATPARPKPSAVRVPIPARWVGHNVESKEESLGTQVIEGVETQGVRYTHTLPAGAIGNQLPIEMVYERWYSPELKLAIMTKQTDPRMGETVYRLTNIERSEPDASLFQIPPDYTVQERPKTMMPQFRGTPEPGKSNDQ